MGTDVLVAVAVTVGVAVGTSVDVAVAVGIGVGGAGCSQATTLSAMADSHTRIESFRNIPIDLSTRAQAL